MSEEPIAIRPAAGPWHRQSWNGTRSVCGEQSYSVYDLLQIVPLSSTAPADRCQTCWPTPKETP